MELRHLRYFVAVAEERSFTRAAARLGIGQPPLSQQIKDLEAELDVRLFRRLPHGAEITAAGEAFLEEARAAIAASARAAQAARRAACGETGRLRIGCTGSGFFNPVVTGALRGFIAKYPDVDVVIEENNTVGLLRQLSEGDLDAAFLRPSEPDLRRLRVHRTIAEPMLVALPAAHPLADRPRVRLDALRDDRIVLYPRRRGPNLHDTVTGACRDAGFEPRLGQEAQQFPSIANLVASGLGISIVPASLAQMHVEGVRFRPIEEPVPVAHLRLVSSVDRANQAATLANFGAVVASLAVSPA
ncbi:MAG: LysR family transcriptional regulator [Methylorubrum populi]